VLEQGRAHQEDRERRKLSPARAQAEPSASALSRGLCLSPARAQAEAQPT
jgi:hypothetical protein